MYLGVFRVVCPELFNKLFKKNIYFYKKQLSCSLNKNTSRYEKLSNTCVTNLLTPELVVY
jgi:hypothetical protein